MQALKDKKKVLLQVLGNIIKKNRGKKSINQLSYEIDLSKSVWSNVEKGRKDIQFTTLWRIIEALDINPAEFIKEVYSELDETFSMIED